MRKREGEREEGVDRRKGGRKEGGGEEEGQALQDLVQTDPAIPPFPGFLL